jgi:putative membrane protein
MVRSLVVALVAMVPTLIGPVAPAAARTVEPSGQDVAYLQAAHEAHLAAMAAGGLARRRASGLLVQDIGARLVTDHTRLDRALTETATRLGVELPETPNGEQRAAAARLERTTGADFDALFISQQLDAHASSMALGERELASGTDPAVKDLAEAAAPVLAAHHTALQDAARELGRPGTVDTGLGGSVAPRSYTSWMVALIAAGTVLLAVGLLLRRRSRPAR